MKVKCTSNVGKDLSQRILRSSIGYFPQTQFPIRKENVYLVYGIALYQEVIHYLIIVEDASLPSWLPAELFKVEDSVLPLGFHFAYFENEEEVGFKALCGYSELVLSDDHRFNLLEREYEAINIFLKRKKEIDETS
jgi:hypothetical protein